MATQSDISSMIESDTVKPLYNGHLSSGVSFAQGVIVDHAPLTVVASYAGVRLWTIKSTVLMKEIYVFLSLR